MTPSRDIQALLDIMAALRTPDGGCAWDLAQTFTSVAPFAVEEAYEVLDAVERGDFEDLRDELGDLLLQVVFHARMAEERGMFGFGEVVEAITAKLIRRHPHVFDRAGTNRPDEVAAVWERVKAEEARERRERRGSGQDPESTVLAGVPRSMPALMRAEKLTRKAAGIGFDWPDAAQVIAKIEEEIEEVRDAAAGGDPDRIEDEIGDLLFAVANLARHFRVEPEGALRRANRKFERRFASIEQNLARQGRSPAEASLAEMERLWAAAKAAGL